MRDLNGLYSNCRLCPRVCGVDRLNGQRGVCRMPGIITAASAVLHKGEEPVLLGEYGSGAVFFSGCTLRCPFCQNVQISCEAGGLELSVDEFSGILLRLQHRGAANINLVTATQFVPSVIESIRMARSSGLNIPVMWNSSGYELPKTIKLLGDSIDIWLPDIKTLNTGTAARLFNTPGYPGAAKSALSAMAEQLRRNGGSLIEDGIMKRGMIVRHLVMPGELESSREVLEWFSRHLGREAVLSLMVQYIPVNRAGEKIAGPDYVISDNDYEQLLQWLDEFEIEEGFLQGPEAASAEWIPDFGRTNPFPDEYSTPVWHWKDGFV